jgi:inner membrane protein
MPTIFSHAIAATAAGRWWGRMPQRFWVWTAACAMLPDADVIAFSFGIPYDAMLGHRGLTHSLFFAVITSAAVTWHVSHASHHRTYPSHPMAFLTP